VIDGNRDELLSANPLSIETRLALVPQLTTLIINLGQGQTGISCHRFPLFFPKKMLRNSVACPLRFMGGE
jgi:hypothetical protein